MQRKMGRFPQSQHSSQVTLCAVGNMNVPYGFSVGAVVWQGTGSGPIILGAWNKKDRFLFSRVAVTGPSVSFGSFLDKVSLSASYLTIIGLLCNSEICLPFLGLKVCAHVPHAPYLWGSDAVFCCCLGSKPSLSQIGGIPQRAMRPLTQHRWWRTARL